MIGAVEELIQWAGIVAVVWIVYRPHRERRPRPGPPSPAATENLNFIAQTVRELDYVQRAAEHEMSRLRNERDESRVQATHLENLTHLTPAARATYLRVLGSSALSHMGQHHLTGLLTEVEAVHIFDGLSQPIHLEDV